MVNHLRRLAAALDLFRDLKTLDGRSKGADAPVQMFETLVLIAADRDVSMRELQDRLGLASSSTSRNVAALSDRHRSGEPGFGLVEKYEDPRDIRFKRVRLTAKGRAFVSRLNAVLGESLECGPVTDERRGGAAPALAGGSGEEILPT